MNRMSVRKGHTPESQRASSAPAKDDKNLIAAYQELCNRHQQIDDFRGKLLALLPIASGAAALALMLNSSGTIDKYLIPIGIYGCAITIGLFIYELHGISVCKQIMRQAGHLEDSLNIPRYMGQYRDQNHNVLHRAIEVEMASWVVYLSVLAGWIYIAGSRGWWDRTSPGYFTNPIWIAGIVVGIVLMKWIYAVFVESRVQRKSENRSIIEQLAAGLFLRCVDHPAGHEPGWRPDDEARGASPVPASASLTAPGS